jgi:hypothetical protein
MSWLLLAHDELGFNRDGQKVRQMSEVRKGSGKSSSRFSSVSSPCPFAQWGVNLVRPMPPGKGNCKFLVVVVDYFTKWAEAEPLVTITTGAIKTFLWKAIVCRFGIPYALVTEKWNAVLLQTIPRMVL